MGSQRVGHDWVTKTFTFTLSFQNQNQVKMQIKIFWHPCEFIKELLQCSLSTVTYDLKPMASVLYNSANRYLELALMNSSLSCSSL